MKGNRLLHPVDAMAKRVTSQKGCVDTLTLEQKRDNLKSILSVLKQKLDILKLLGKTKGQRRDLGLEIERVSLEINKLRPKKKAPGVERYIMDVLKEDLNKCQWNALMKKAVKRRENDLRDGSHKKQENLTTLNG